MDVREGAVEVTVPEQPEAGAGDVVFFNPDQELNRDVTIAALRAYQEREPRADTYLDANAASGIRGVRAAADGWNATCCDIDEEAVALARENFDRNDLEGEVVHRNANALMHEEWYDVIDVDPFGTPMPFADAALANARDLVCITATDTAPLCGAHFESGVRSYSAVPRNTDFHAEMGLRILLSALVRTAARYDVAATPILSHVSDHYVRTYLDLTQSASGANDAIDQLGHVAHCQRCLYRETEPGLIANMPQECPHCDEHLGTAGPIYLGSVQDDDFLEATKDEITAEMGTASRARDLVDRLQEELDTPTHYDQHRLAKRWTEPAIGMDEFLDRLRDAGYEASRAQYGGTTFKTTADVTEIEAVGFGD
jgi:tRNA (guanine26-N2/guanine27-N2)-dimethyltransferase